MANIYVYLWNLPVDLLGDALVVFVSPPVLPGDFSLFTIENAYTNNFTQMRNTLLIFIIFFFLYFASWKLCVSVICFFCFFWFWYFCIQNFLFLFIKYVENTVFYFRVYNLLFFFWFKFRTPLPLSKNFFCFIYSNLELSYLLII